VIEATDRRFDGFCARFERPKQPETLTVPAKEGIGSDDLKDLLPVGNPAGEEKQGQSLAQRKPRRSLLTVQNDQLLKQ